MVDEKWGLGSLSRRSENRNPKPKIRDRRRSRTNRRGEAEEESATRRLTSRAQKMSRVCGAHFRVDICVELRVRTDVTGKMWSCANCRKEKTGGVAADSDGG